jgi:hypothetical protein
MRCVKKESCDVDGIINIKKAVILDHYSCFKKCIKKIRTYDQFAYLYGSDFDMGTILPFCLKKYGLKFKYLSCIFNKMEIYDIDLLCTVIECCSMRQCVLLFKKPLKIWVKKAFNDLTNDMFDSRFNYNKVKRISICLRYDKYNFIFEL